MSLTVTADFIVASIDGDAIITLDNPNLPINSVAGIFLRGNGSTKIEDFTVTVTFSPITAPA